MPNPIRLSLPFVLGLILCVSFSPAASCQNDTTAPEGATKESRVTSRATGSFDVKMNPQPPGEGEGESIARMVLDKKFSGDLAAASQGQMLAFRSPVDGSAGYVAMEQVHGTLDGRRGSFVLQHSGIMDRGEPGLTLVVVPDSGTDELEGLTGSMAILIESGEHSYDFEYSLPSPP